VGVIFKKNKHGEKEGLGEIFSVAQNNELF
jgi:hypothetical protein